MTIPADTPRTDDAVFAVGSGKHVVGVKFAHQLERELAILQREHEKCLPQVVALAVHIAAANERISEFERELAAAKRETEAIRELMNIYNLGGWTDAIAPMKRALAADKCIAELENLIPLVSEVMANHRDPQSGEYNECEKRPCMWCDIAQKAIDAARAKEGK